jgi:hypothetical protein
MNLSKLSVLSALCAATLLCGFRVRPAHPRSLDVPMHLPIATVPQDIGNIGETPAFFLITTMAHYEQMFGEDARGVDFSHEWAFLYSAGLEPTGGYEALVDDVVYMPDTGLLVISTTLVSPGANCVVPQIVTKPYMLVKFPQPPGKVVGVRFNPDYQVLDCRGN